MHWRPRLLNSADWAKKSPFWQMNIRLSLIWSISWTQGEQRPIRCLMGSQRARNLLVWWLLSLSWRSRRSFAAKDWLYKKRCWWCVINVCNASFRQCAPPMEKPLGQNGVLWFSPARPPKRDSTKHDPWHLSKYFGSVNVCTTLLTHATCCQQLGVQTQDLDHLFYLIRVEPVLLM